MQIIQLWIIQCHSKKKNIQSWKIICFRAKSDMFLIVDISVTRITEANTSFSLTMKGVASELSYLNNATDITYTGQIQFLIIKNRKEKCSQSHMFLSNLVIFTHLKLILELECKEHAGLADTSRVPVNAAGEVTNLHPGADIPLPLESKLTFYLHLRNLSVMIMSVFFNAWSYFTLKNQGVFDELLFACYFFLTSFASFYFYFLRQDCFHSALLIMQVIRSSNKAGNDRSAPSLGECLNNILQVCGTTATYCFNLRVFMDLQRNVINQYFYLEFPLLFYFSYFLECVCIFFHVCILWH